MSSICGVPINLSCQILLLQLFPFCFMSSYDVACQLASALSLTLLHVGHRLYNKKKQNSDLFSTEERVIEFRFCFTWLV